MSSIHAKTVGGAVKQLTTYYRAAASTGKDHSTCTLGQFCFLLQLYLVGKSLRKSLRKLSPPPKSSAHVQARHYLHSIPGVKKLFWVLLSVPV